jgi:hypothetical protein
LISIIAIGVLLFAGFQYMVYNTKKMSPEATVTYVQADYDISVFYNSPSVRERAIFGNLVPYGKIWRTGANEPTTFTTASELDIQGKSLPAGKYTLWTIPGAEEWDIIFNSKEYGWGVGMDGKVSREKDSDVLVATVPTERIPNIVEQFAINLVSMNEGFEMQLAWENHLVRLPIK